MKKWYNINVVGTETTTRQKRLRRDGKKNKKPPPEKRVVPGGGFLYLLYNFLHKNYDIVTNLLKFKKKLKKTIDNAEHICYNIITERKERRRQKAGAVKEPGRKSGAEVRGGSQGQKSEAEVNGCEAGANKPKRMLFQVLS